MGSLDFEVAVVGAGVMGLATARALARAGRDVVLLEQFALGHDRGSSHGTSRIFRFSYPEEEWVRLAQEALPLWRELEAEAGEPLLDLHGSVDLGDWGANRDALAAAGADFEILDRSDAERRFGLALDALLRMLALLMVRDGEGARRVGRVVVHGGHEDTVVRAARAVADSPLVKAALHGGDPNWGRIAQAVGGARHDSAPLPVDIAIEGVQVCSGGAAVPHDAAALARAVAGEEVEYEVGLPGEGVEAEVFFSDLSHEYVTINAEYTT